MSERPPASDWATDFDHTDPRWVENPFPIWDEMRQQCPIAHTNRFRGVYFPSRYEDVRAIAYDTTHFSSRRVVVREQRVENPIPVPPITSDPPAHTPARKLLLPAFSPNAIKKLEPLTRKLCNELLDAIVGRERCDAAVDYAQHIPVRVIAHMLGIPESDGDMFRAWIHEILDESITEYDNNNNDGAEERDEMLDYFRAQVAQKQLQRGDDLISFLLDARIDGQPLSAPHLFGTLRLILIAGIDTTWSAIGASLWHLASQPADRARLVAEPALMPTAVEELLRAYAPVTMAREIVKDVEINGCPMKAGNMVLLPFPSANRDPEMFPDADKVVLDRQENRHAAFGLGIHRCLGSNLARMEVTVALEEWLKRIPEFRLADPAAVTWSRGTVRGPRKLPVVLG
jgi:cytochrome P450